MNPWLIFGFGIFLGFCLTLVVFGLLYMTSKNGREMEALDRTSGAGVPACDPLAAGYRPGSSADPRD